MIFAAKCLKKAVAEEFCQRLNRHGVKAVFLIEKTGRCEDVEGEERILVLDAEEAPEYE